MARDRANEVRLGHAMQAALLFSLLAFLACLSGTMMALRYNQPEWFSPVFRAGVLTMSSVLLIVLGTRWATWRLQRTARSRRAIRQWALKLPALPRIDARLLKWAGRLLAVVLVLVVVLLVIATVLLMLGPSSNATFSTVSDTFD